MIEPIKLAANQFTNTQQSGEARSLASFGKYDGMFGMSSIHSIKEFPILTNEAFIPVCKREAPILKKYILLQGFHTWWCHPLWSIQVDFFTLQTLFTPSCSCNARINLARHIQSSNQLLPAFDPRPYSSPSRRPVDTPKWVFLNQVYYTTETTVRQPLDFRLTDTDTLNTRQPSAHEFNSLVFWGLVGFFDLKQW